jgi:methionine synthase / methylenetetrahydrofolate reductase(NADPH)
LIRSDEESSRSAGPLPTLREMLDGPGIHLLDGAMGTVLYERGIFVNVCYDELSVSEPRLVESIHREYVDAGAELLETNTFGANPVKLSSFGLGARTEELNRAAAEVAIRAAGGRARVLGAVGPLGIRIEPWGPTAEEEAEGFFRRQIQGLLEGGVEGILLETFQDLTELRQALRAARSLSDVPVFAQVTIEEGGHTAYGTEVERVATALEEWGADALGLNCSVGPAEILDAVERMARVVDRPLVAQPNAGLPRTVGDRKMYMASPEYMARYARRMVEAGVRFVGGCCGTTPEHIRRMAEALQEFGPSRVSGPPPTDGRPREARPRVRVEASPPSPVVAARVPAAEPAPLHERSPWGRKLAREVFVTSVELVPPRGWNTQPLLDEARRARLAGVDAVAIPDSPRGLSRMGSLPAAVLVSRETGLDVVAHYTCRDRNMLGMISDLLGAQASGIRNLLVVSGDLSPSGPYPDHTAVFDIDAIGLTNVLHHLNRGVDPGGHPVEPATEFVIGVALNQGAADLEREERRFGWKVEAGAEFAVTQPVFDPPALETFLERTERWPVPVIAGLWPLDSLRNAEFLANEVPGVRVPSSVVGRMREAEARGADAAVEEGIRIAVEGLEAVLPLVRGIHVSAPRGRVDLALRVVEEARSLLHTRAIR